MIKSRNFLKKTELVNYGKKVLIISTNLRGGSNSDILANECAKGAKEAGHMNMLGCKLYIKQ